MIDSGVLTDYTATLTSTTDHGELQKMTIKGSLDDELAKLKAERQRKEIWTT